MRQIFLVLEHHVIAVPISRCVPPSRTQFDLLLTVVVFQVITLGFGKDDFAALCHNHNIRVVVEVAVEDVYKRQVLFSTCKSVGFSTPFLRHFRVGLHRET